MKKLRGLKNDLFSALSDALWRAHCYHLYSFPASHQHRAMAKFCERMYYWLRGEFSFGYKTPWGWFGFYWYMWGVWNFDISFGRFCKILARPNWQFFIKFYQLEQCTHRSRSPEAYWLYWFGHRIEWVSSDPCTAISRSVPVSQWHWGRFHPYATEASVVQEGKIFGIIGFGRKPEKRDPLYHFDPPLGYFSDIISDFLIKNAWRVCSCQGENECPGGWCAYALSKRVVIPCRPRRFLKPGDVVIFSDCDKDADRFYVITKEDIKEWKKGERSLLPEGIVFRPSTKIQEVLISCGV